MKITLLTDGIYPFVMGGMQKHSYYLAKYLAKNKVEVNLYHCVANDKPLVENLEGFTEEEMKYITHHCFHFPKLDSFPGHYLREHKLLSELYLKHFIDICHIERNAVEPKYLVGDKNDSKIDSSTSLHFAQNDDMYIYTQGFTGRAFIEAKNKGLDLPHISVNFHGLNMFQKAPSLRVKLEHLLLRGSAKYNIKNADSAVSLGGKLTGILKNIGAKKIVEQGIGIEKSWLTDISEISEMQGNNSIKFVFVGRYERGKGIEEFSEVISELSSENIEFHFIGPIPDKFKLKSEKFKVEYHGAIYEEEKIKSILKSCDVLVSPSWSEGMPTVILEAMASGCAIIATDVGAVSVQVDESNGWLIEAGNKHQLKNAILSAIETSSEELLKKKIASVKNIKEKFLWDDVIKENINKYCCPPTLLTKLVLRI